MIKNIIVNLPVGSANTAATGYAISVAGEFGAHLAGIAFAYRPVLPGTIFGSVRSELIDAALAELVKSARGAAAGFDDAARRARGFPPKRGYWRQAWSTGLRISAASRAALTLQSSGKPEPGKHSAGEPDRRGDVVRVPDVRVLVVPYIQRQPLKLDRIWCAGMGAAMRRARPPTRCRSSPGQSSDSSWWKASVASPTRLPAPILPVIWPATVSRWMSSGS